MSQVSQKEAVFNAVTNVLTENNISVADGTDVSPLMSRDFRSQVNAILFEGFRSGSIQIDRTFSDSELKTYVSGLQSNWLRKDKRLNGGSSYSAKNPGSRVGSGDAQLKNLRALLSTLSTEAERNEVQSYIDARVSEIKSSKARSSVTIDTSLLPAGLAKLVSVSK